MNTLRQRRCRITFHLNLHTTRIHLTRIMSHALVVKVRPHDIHAHEVLARWRLFGDVEDEVGRLLLVVVWQPVYRFCGIRVVWFEAQSVDLDPFPRAVVAADVAAGGRRGEVHE